MSSDVLGRSNGVPSETTTFCVWCGNRFAPDVDFCTHCGRSALDSSAVPPMAPQAPAPTAIRTAQPRVDFYPAQRTADYDTIRFTPPPLNTAPRPRKRAGFGDVLRSKWTLLAAGGVALLLVLVLVGSYAYGAVRNRPVHEAFDAVQSLLSTDVRGVSSAKDMAGLQASAAQLGTHLPTIQAHAATLAGVNTELGVASHRVVQAELSFATAAAQLAKVSPNDFTWWGALHGDLKQATDDLSAATRALDPVDGDAADSVVPAGAALDRLEHTIGVEVADAARARLGDLFDRLSGAQRTSVVREVAATAKLEAATVDASLGAVPAGSAEADTLQAHGDVYRAIGQLQSLDGDHLGIWHDVRLPLVATLRGPDARLLDAGAGRAAIANLDRLVREGRTKLEAWKSSYKEAVADREADLGALERYRSAMESEMRKYSGLRTSLSDWIDRVDSPSSYVTYSEAYRVLNQAQWDRQDVRDTMSSLSVPPEAASAHQQVITVLDDAINAVSAAYDGAWDSEYCVSSCYYADTPGWREFRSESSRITQAYDAASRSWESGVSSARNAIEGRQLPKKPVI